MAPMYPNLKKCHKPSGMPPYAKCLNCCPPYKGETPDRFEFPENLPMRTRRAAHKVDDNYRHKYALAVQLMKNLAPDDPRNFMQQANVHCAYCKGAYNMGDTEKPFNVHAGWFFLPWHRWFLYFHERILATLLCDDTFALPFWNWDFEQGMTVPPMYIDEKQTLFDNKRNYGQPNGFVDLGFSYGKEGYIAGLSREDLVHNNYKIMHKQIVSLASQTRCFHGEKILENSSTCTCGAGTLENEPHNTVHDWTGTVQSPKCQQDPCPTETCYGEDMGNLYSAARDPIFYAHHANVDRMWTIWKTLPGRNDYEDQDLLDTRFYFYDENASLVEVRAGDAFDPEKLRYKYEEMPIPWVEPRYLLPAGSMLSLSAPPIAAAVLTLDWQDPTFSTPVKILNVARKPPTSRTLDEDEVLVIEGIRVQSNITVKFDVFVQLDDSRVFTSYVHTVPPEYAGTYVELARGAIDDVEDRCGQSSMHVVISEVLRNLGARGEEDNLVVTLIPKVNLEQRIRISALRVE